MPVGRVLFASDRGNFAVPSVLGPVSAAADLVMCIFDERVMVSEASAYRDGAMVWSVSYDPSKTQRISTSGDLPPEYGEILADLERQQEQNGGADYIFDLPQTLATRFGRFSVNEDIDGFDGVVTLVEKDKGSGRRKSGGSVFERLFFWLDR